MGIKERGRGEIIVLERWVDLLEERRHGGGRTRNLPST